MAKDKVPIKKHRVFKIKTCSIPALFVNTSSSQNLVPISFLNHELKQKIELLCNVGFFCNRSFRILILLSHFDKSLNCVNFIINDFPYHDLSENFFVSMMTPIQKPCQELFALQTLISPLDNNSNINHKTIVL